MLICRFVEAICNSEITSHRFEFQSQVVKSIASRDCGLDQTMCPTVLKNMLCIHPSEVLFVLRCCEVSCGGSISKVSNMDEQGGESLLTESRTIDMIVSSKPFASNEVKLSSNANLFLYNKELSEIVINFEDIKSKLLNCFKIEDEEYLFIVQAPVTPEFSYNNIINNESDSKHAVSKKELETAVQELKSMQWIIRLAKATLNNVYASNSIPSTSSANRELMSIFEMLNNQKTNMERVIKDVNYLYSLYKSFELYKDILKATTDSYLRWYKGADTSLHLSCSEIKGFEVINNVATGTSNEFSPPMQKGTAHVSVESALAQKNSMVVANPAQAIVTAPRQNSLYFVMQNVFDVKSLQKKLSVTSLTQTPASPIANGASPNKRTKSKLSPPPPPPPASGVSRGIKLNGASVSKTNLNNEEKLKKSNKNFVTASAK